MANLDPSYAIQVAVVAALTGSPDMIAAFGGAPRGGTTCRPTASRARRCSLM